MQWIDPNDKTQKKYLTAKWCKPCRETGAIHCSDPVNCGGPWDAREARPPTPTGWSDTDWLEHLQERQHPLAGLHINQGSMDALADSYEAEYNARHNAEVSGRPSGRSA